MENIEKIVFLLAVMASPILATYAIKYFKKSVRICLIKYKVQGESNYFYMQRNCSKTDFKKEISRVINDISRKYESVAIENIVIY